jgi:hypothetical protein
MLRRALHRRESGDQDQAEREAASAHALILTPEEWDKVTA